MFIFLLQTIWREGPKRFHNHFAGHFLLTDLLLETMKNTARESNREGRVVNLSSEGHRFAYSEGIRFDKINDESAYCFTCTLFFVYLVVMLNLCCETDTREYINAHKEACNAYRL